MCCVCRQLGQRHEWLTAARVLANDKGFLGVAGFHFHPQHLIEILVAITEFPVRGYAYCGRSVNIVKSRMVLEFLRLF